MTTRPAFIYAFHMCHWFFIDPLLPYTVSGVYIKWRQYRSIKEYEIRMTYNSITFIPEFLNIRQLLQILKEKLAKNVYPYYEYYFEWMWLTGFKIEKQANSNCKYVWYEIMYHINMLCEENAEF
jgi:hypothetical protein